jgi:hypothetical protein
MPVFMPWPQSGRMQYEKIKSNRAAGRDGNSGRLDGSLGVVSTLGLRPSAFFSGGTGSSERILGMVIKSTIRTIYRVEEIYTAVSCSGIILS